MKIGIGTYLLVALVLTCALAATTQAQVPKNNDAPRIGAILNPNFGNPGPNDVTTDTPCQVMDPMDPTHFDPADDVVLDADGTYHIKAPIWDGLECVGDPGVVAEGDLTLVAGEYFIFIGFQGGLPPGTQLSMTWEYMFGGQDYQTVCYNYTMGDGPPGICGAAKRKK